MTKVVEIDHACPFEGFSDVFVRCNSLEFRFAYQAKAGHVEVHDLYGRVLAEGIQSLVQSMEGICNLRTLFVDEIATGQWYVHRMFLSQIPHISRACKLYLSC